MHLAFIIFVYSIRATGLQSISRLRMDEQPCLDSRRDFPTHDHGRRNQIHETPDVPFKAGRVRNIGVLGSGAQVSTMSTFLNRRQFDLVEVFVTAVVVGVCVLQFTQTRLPPPYGFPNPATWQEFDRLKAAYGPAHYSQFQEEWIIRDFFKDKREGLFVDVGANHYRDGSTTFYLEKQLGWSGVAIDPQRDFEFDYRRYRPRTRFFPFFVSDVSNQTAKLYMVNLETQTVSANRPQEPLALTTEIDAPTVTLTDLLGRLAIRQVDFVSVDVEGSEPKVLDGFDIDRFRPMLVCIEAHVGVRQQMLDFFAKHAYVVVGRYLRVDTLNPYFTPVGPVK